MPVDGPQSRCWLVTRATTPFLAVAAKTGWRLLAAAGGRRCGEQVVAFNARWEVSPRSGEGKGPTTALARQRGEDFLMLDW